MNRCAGHPAGQESHSGKSQKARLPVSELMMCSAFAYEPDDSDAELGALAVVAKAAADSASACIDDALRFIEASNKRIAAMEPGNPRPVPRVSCNGSD